MDRFTEIVEYRVRVREKPPSTDWGLVLGDMLTNLRAALDHALYFHVTTRNALSMGDLRKIEFPICDTEQKWNSWTGKKVAREWAGEKFVNAIRLLQPIYVKGKYLPADTILYALNELVNTDKHRICHVVAYHGEATFNPVADPLRDKFVRTTRNGELTDRAVIATRRQLRARPRLDTPAPHKIIEFVSQCRWASLTWSRYPPNPGQ